MRIAVHKTGSLPIIGVEHWAQNRSSHNQHLTLGISQVNVEVNFNLRVEQPALKAYIL